MTNTITPTPTPTVEPRPAVGWTELAIAAVSYLVLSVGLVIPLFLLSGLDDVPTPAVLLAGTVATLGAVGIALAPRVRSLAPLRLRLPGRRWLLAGLAAGIGVCLVNRLVVFGWIAVTGDSSNPQQYLTDGAAAGGWSTAAVILLGGLLIPFAEELLFRGIGYSALRRYGLVVAILGSAAIFGLAHGFTVVLVAAFLLGVVNAWMVERSGSIWPAVAAHAVNNTILLSLAAVLV